MTDVTGVSEGSFRWLHPWMNVAIVMMAALPAYAEATFTRIPTQYIAALGNPQASSGTEAETWGLWAIDPGPRGVRIDDYADLIANADVAPDGWTFDRTA